MYTVYIYLYICIYIYIYVYTYISIYVYCIHDIRHIIYTSGRIRRWDFRRQARLSVPPLRLAELPLEEEAPGSAGGIFIGEMCVFSPGKGEFILEMVSFCWKWWVLLDMVSLYWKL